MLILLKRRENKVCRGISINLRKSFATGTLQQNQIRFLLKVDDETKVRRATKSLVLGTAKVMGYEEVQHARAKRAEAEAAKKTKLRENEGGSVRECHQRLM
ncbi:hypothetical protein PSPO01_16138 [Paraphaeosphaeria sporulosa]